MSRIFALVPLAMLLVSLMLSAVALAGGGGGPAPTPPCLPEQGC
jgi:hypothetical protein